MRKKNDYQEHEKTQGFAAKSASHAANTQFPGDLIHTFVCKAFIHLLYISTATYLAQHVQARTC